MLKAALPFGTGRKGLSGSFGMTITVRSALPGRTYSGFFETIGLTFFLGPYSSSLTMAVVEIAEEYKKVLWNHGGSSDEIFRHGQRYLVGIASPASDYLRALPHWLAEEFPGLGRICVVYSGRGAFGWQVARGILESLLVEAGQSVELSQSTLPSKTTTPFFGRCSTSIRRLLFWR